MSYTVTTYLEMLALGDGWFSLGLSIRAELLMLSYLLLEHDCIQT
jgi:hypothetical protein